MAVNFFTETDVIITKHISSTIYGEPGIGKSSLAFTAENVFLIDFDMGVQRCVNRGNFVRVDKWEDVIQLQRSPQFAKLNPDTIVLDTGGTMIDNYISKYAKKQDPLNSRRGGELSQQGYGAMKSIFKQFKNWTKTINCNVVFICHATTDPNKDRKIIPKMTGGALDILRQESDLIGYMHSSKDKRVIDFRPIDSHDGKDCANIGIVEVPDYKTPEYKTFLQEITNKTLDRMNEITKEQAEIIAKIEEYRGKVTKIKTVDDCNDLIKKLMAEHKSIQIQIFTEIKTYSKENKIAVYDSETKSFVKDV